MSFLNEWISQQENLRTRTTERLEEYNLVVVNIPGGMKWCTVSIEEIIVPYFLDNVNFTAESYRSMLIHFAFPRFRLLQQHYPFQQDSASS